jgi:hypothetical protein
MISVLGEFVLVWELKFGILTLLGCIESLLFCL